MKKLIPFEDPDDGKWGYLDEDGDIALLAMYDFAEEFNGDYARVVIGGNEMFINKDGDLCFDREGTTYNPDDYEVEENDDEGDDYDDYEVPSKPKKSSLLGKLAKSAWQNLKDSGKQGSSSSSNSKSDVKKVWTGTYHGRDPRAPKILSVPSSRMLDRPSYEEIEDALVAMGMDRDTARVVKGASISDWDFK